MEINKQFINYYDRQKYSKIIDDSLPIDIYKTLLQFTNSINTDYLKPVLSILQRETDRINELLLLAEEKPDQFNNIVKELFNLKLHELPKIVNNIETPNIYCEYNRIINLFSSSVPPHLSPIVQRYQFPEELIKNLYKQSKPIFDVKPIINYIQTANKFVEDIKRIKAEHSNDFAWRLGAKALGLLFFGTVGSVVAGKIAGQMAGQDLTNQFSNGYENVSSRIYAIAKNNEKYIASFMERFDFISFDLFGGLVRKLNNDFLVCGYQIDCVDWKNGILTLSIVQEEKLKHIEWFERTVIGITLAAKQKDWNKAGKISSQLAKYMNINRVIGGVPYQGKSIGYWAHVVHYSVIGKIIEAMRDINHPQYIQTLITYFKENKVAVKSSDVISTGGPSPTRIIMIAVDEIEKNAESPENIRISIAESINMYFTNLNNRNNDPSSFPGEAIEVEIEILSKNITEKAFSKKNNINNPIAPNKYRYKDKVNALNSLNQQIPNRRSKLGRSLINKRLRVLYLQPILIIISLLCIYAAWPIISQGYYDYNTQRAIRIAEYEQEKKMQAEAETERRRIKAQMFAAEKAKEQAALDAAEEERKKELAKLAENKNKAEQVVLEGLEAARKNNFEETNWRQYFSVLYKDKKLPRLTPGDPKYKIVLTRAGDDSAIVVFKEQMIYYIFLLIREGDQFKILDHQYFFNGLSELEDFPLDDIDENYYESKYCNYEYWQNYPNSD